MVDRPLDVLEATIGSPVRVALKAGDTLHGELAGFDQHMNLVLDPLVDEDTPPSGDSAAVDVEDTTVIRGDNVVRIDT